jgi:hypothetical protein
MCWCLLTYIATSWFFSSPWGCWSLSRNTRLMLPSNTFSRTASSIPYHKRKKSRLITFHECTEEEQRYYFLNSARDGMNGQRHTPLLYPGKDRVPIVQETGWTPGPLWTGAENLAPTRVRTPNRLAHESRYTAYDSRKNSRFLAISRTI